jgi:5'(3')-deoxyribonucleotidase
MITEIVLDLDDTLNSLTMHILNRLGSDVDPLDYESYPHHLGYDIIGAWSELTGRPQVPVDMFWEWVSRRTWETAPKSGQFWLITAAAALVDKENVMIATVPTKSPDCHYAKYQWMENHLPEWMQRQYSITPRKNKLSHEGVLLIDDCDANILDFIDRGGDGILVPRPWNSLYYIGTNNATINDYLANELYKREMTNVL